jgi:hypothetical protein
VGKKKSTSKPTNEPPKWAVPHLQGAMGTISNTVNANQGNLDEMAGQIRGFLPGLGEKAFGANPGLDAANQYAMDAIGGKYLDQQNPYLQGMIDQTSGDVSNRVNSMFAKAGASMGSPHAQVLSKELANSQNSLRYGNYTQERQMQQNAAGMLPALNQAQYAGIMPYLAANQTAAGLPFTGISNLGQIGSLAGGYGTQSGTQPGGWGNQLLGAAASALPFILCEREAKTKIELLRRDPDGLGWYAFAYKREPDIMLEGPMADEVEALRPWALGPRLSNGWRTVNMAKIREAA